MKLIEGSKEATTNFILDGSGIKLAPNQTNKKGSFIDHVISTAKGDLEKQYRNHLFGKKRKTRSSKSNKNSKEEQIGKFSEGVSYNMDFGYNSLSYNSDDSPGLLEEVTPEVF